jgi:hypothetical protein
MHVQRYVYGAFAVLNFELDAVCLNWNAVMFCIVLLSRGRKLFQQVQLYRY